MRALCQDQHQHTSTVTPRPRRCAAATLFDQLSVSPQHDAAGALAPFSLLLCLLPHFFFSFLIFSFEMYGVLIAKKKNT